MSGIYDRGARFYDALSGEVLVYRRGRVVGIELASMVAVVRPGGRIGIVDMKLPEGGAALLAPLARLACSIGGSDIHAHPWTALYEQGHDLTETTLRGGHIVAASASFG